jgi:hypothetical protein
VTRQLGDGGKIRGPEKSAIYPEHVQAADGKYADVHVQTVDDIKAEGFGKGLLSIVAATSMAAGASQDATAGEIVSAAIWDAAKAIDPLFVTDIIEHATGLDDYEEDRVRDNPPQQ